MESIDILLPKNLENLQLPDPNLLQYYKDIEDRVLYLEGGIGDESDPDNSNSMGIVKKIIQYNKEDKNIPDNERKPIKIFIDSYGGDALRTAVLVNVIEMSKTPIYTINLCDALSAAGYVLAAGHKRFAIRGTSVLIHTGSVYYNGDKVKIDASKKHNDKIVKELIDKFLSKTKINSKTYKTKAPKEWYLDANDALNYGVIDRIINTIDEII